MESRIIAYFWGWIRWSTFRVEIRVRVPRRRRGGWLGNDRFLLLVVVVVAVVCVRQFRILGPFRLLPKSQILLTPSFAGVANLFLGGIGFGLDGFAVGVPVGMQGNVTSVTASNNKEATLAGGRLFIFFRKTYRATAAASGWLRSIVKASRRGNP